MYRVDQGTDVYLYAIFETSRHWGRVVCFKDKVIKALEKKSIKEWAYAIHDKDSRSSQEFEGLPY